MYFQYLASVFVLFLTYFALLMLWTHSSLLLCALDQGVAVCFRPRGAHFPERAGADCYTCEPKPPPCSPSQSQPCPGCVFIHKVQLPSPSVSVCFLPSRVPVAIPALCLELLFTCLSSLVSLLLTFTDSSAVLSCSSSVQRISVQTLRPRGRDRALVGVGVRN